MSLEIAEFLDFLRINITSASMSSKSSTHPNKYSGLSEVVRGRPGKFGGGSILATREI